MREVDPRRLTRKQQRELQRSKSFDELAEDIVAEEYGLDEDNDQDWYDCRDDGTKYQVKSTSLEVGDKYRAKGRFRLWQDQHRSLATAEGQGSAWYVFVLFDSDAGVLRLQRRRPTTVTRIVQDRGGWNRSGHERDARQHKLPQSAALYP